MKTEKGAMVSSVITLDSWKAMKNSSKFFIAQAISLEGVQGETVCGAAHRGEKGKL